MTFLLRLADVLRVLTLRVPRFVGLQEGMIGMALAVCVFLVAPWLHDAYFLAEGPGRLRFNWWSPLGNLALISGLAWYAWVVERTSAQVTASDVGVSELSTQEELETARSALSASAILATLLLASAMLDLLFLLTSIVFPEFSPLYLFGWWLLCVTVASLRMLSAAGVWSATKMQACLAALLPFFALTYLSVKRPTGSFVEREVLANSAARDVLASDEIWALQQEMIRDRNARLLPDSKGKVDAYFIAYAPDAEEDVFLRETTVIQHLMDERFRTEGRSLRLINHASLYRTEPIATIANLEKSLRQVGLLHNPKEDLVFIYLTGHGSKAGELQSRADQMLLTNLSAQRLDALLRNAGIQNAVIAVSACYSGSWIPALRDASRAIFTASSAERTSFGCGSESNFTFWGKAVFDEGLRSTVSIEQAFKDAIPRLREREKQAGHEFSDPQSYLGEAIRPLLARWEKQISDAQGGR